MLTLAVLIAWLAAGYRLLVSLSQPRTLWRSSFTAVTLTVALAFTMYDFRAGIDQYLGVPDLTGLLSRLVITVGAGFLLVYLHALRVEIVPATALAVYGLITVGVLATLVISWSAASFPQREVDDLLASPSAAVAVYCLSFWLFQGLALTLTARTCLSRWRTVRHGDPGREVSLLLTASGAIVGLAVLGLWSVSLVLTVAGPSGSAFNAVGDRLLPAAEGLVAVGVICPAGRAVLASLVVTWRRWKALRPLWMELVRRSAPVKPVTRHG